MRFWGWLLLLPGLAPAWAAGPGSPLPAAEPATVAMMELEPAGTLELGPLPPAVVRRMSFTVVNRGRVATRIKQVRTGCSCTAVADYEQGPIPAGGRTVLHLDLNSGKLPDGKFERSALVLFAPPAAPLTLRFAGEVRRPFAVVPAREQHLGMLRSRTAPWVARFELEARRVDGTRARPGVPECRTPGVTARLLPGDRENRWCLEVTGAAPLPLGPFETAVRLPVTAPPGLADELFTVRGRVGPELFAQPAILKLPAGVPAPVTRTVELSFRDTAEQDVKVDELQFKTPAGVQAAARPAAAGVVVDLTFSPAALKTPALGQLEVATPRSAPLILRYVVGPVR
ncbi:MAG: DUF1573 domain-containing protein [Lentisphaeria bacterium]